MRLRSAFCVVFLGLPGAAKLAGASPNIVLILTDDHGWSQTSHVTDPRVPASVSRYLETPNMNRLAREGMRFTSGYSPAPLCTPTRRSILCGASTARCGSEFKSKWVPAEHMTIHKALKLADSNYGGDATGVPKVGRCGDAKRHRAKAEEKTGEAQEGNGCIDGEITLPNERPWR